MAKVIKDGYGQIELNRCSFLHDGNIESQCVTEEALENGILVNVNKAEGMVVPAETFDVVLGVNYTSERNYNQFKPGRKNFRVEAGEYPRIGYLKAGDVFTTNAYLKNGEDLPEVGTYLQEDGTHSDEKMTRLMVAEITDTADGQTAVKYQVM